MFCKGEKVRKCAFFFLYAKIILRNKNIQLYLQSQNGKNYWCGSSVWLEYRPVTPGVAGSSPVRTARFQMQVAQSSTLQPLKGKIQDWCGSSVWLEYRPVTPGVAGSSPVRTARKEQLFELLFFYIFTTFVVPDKIRTTNEN